ncbi:recombinase [Arthrobacter phage Tank]|uniref:RAD52-like DNA recombinase n=1 Tax=Arthrobacter phage Tank TaxID=1772319 RepID=A0A0U4JKT0_9CAUD|nr:recombinase [Arthrobacter phage Tank]ALY10596.1 RAD52-like DNA recombinase [Arthrobacter phage Tank]
MTFTPMPPPHFNYDEVRPLTESQLKTLMANLQQSRVAAKKGMSYLEAWDVKAMLNRVFGFGGWSLQIIHQELVYREQVPQSSNKDKMNWSIAFSTTSRLIIPQLAAFYDEVAVGFNAQPVLGEAMDMALKSSASDALKRCAIQLGTQFGLSLYDSGSTNDVVRWIVAPGQEWRNGARFDAESVKKMQAAVEGQHPQAAHGVERHPGVTDEQHAVNQGLLNSALSARAAKDAEQDPAGQGYQQHVADPFPGQATVDGQPVGPLSGETDN